jgi:hypothetical protein
MGRGRVSPFDVRQKQTAMLQRIQIKNYRSCKDVTLEELGYVTALVGRNASGKTNILSAISLLARMATATDLAPLSSGIHAPGRPVPSFHCELLLGGLAYRYSLAAGLNAARVQWALKEDLSFCPDGEHWIALLHRSDRELQLVGRTERVPLGPTTPSLPAVLSLFPRLEEVLRHIPPLLRFWRATRYYPFEEANEVHPPPDGLPFISNVAYQKWVAQFRSGGGTEDSVSMRLLYAYFEEKSLYNEILSLLGPKGLDVIQGITFSTFPARAGAEENDRTDQATRYHSIRFRPGRSLGGGSDLYHFYELSLGTRRLLRILVSLVVDGSSLMLIEHPEESLHSGLLKKLVGLLRVNVDPAQIILSSHAAEVVNALRAEDLRLVTIHRGATSVRALATPQVGAATRFIKEEGSLAEFLESVEE